MTTRVHRSCHAKVNLMLSVGPPMAAGTIEGGVVGGKDVSGFHAIASWMAPIDLADDLIVERVEGDAGAKSRFEITFAPDAPRVERVDWPLERDLVFRAHAALEQKVGAALPVAVTLRKRIPTRSGLGGGSSDAAGMLMAAREAFPEHAAALTDDVLTRIAMSLGSDVAYFLDTREGAAAGHVGSTAHAPRHALVSGFGERIERVQGVEGRILLVVPGVSCGTGAVYAAFDRRLVAEAPLRQRTGGQREPSLEPKVEMIRQRHARALEQGPRADHFFNDLAKPAFDVEPRLGTLATAIASMTRLATHVTGSGSCLFVWPEGSEIGRRGEAELKSGARSQRDSVDHARFEKAREKVDAAAQAWAQGNATTALVRETRVLAP
jgi:4-diphosphocytidyl-2-C-methyl-D-erythritol kinase